LQKSNDKRYGLVGSKEFHNNRKEILNEFSRAKEYNVSRPVRVQHGKAGEAAVRKWLSDYLPKKYGVTSGFVIPDVIAAEYKLYHFDVLIYDQINSPELWSDGDCDQSEQGKIRAIPAKHVRAALEIKASLNSKTARDSITKLSEFNNLANHLPASFSCGTIFFDLDTASANNQVILPNLLPSTPIIGYWGGLVLHCALNEEMAGLLELIKLPENKEEINSLTIPIAKNVDELNIYRDEHGNIAIGEQGAGVMAFDGPDKQWHFSKEYGPVVYGQLFGLTLTWSHNGFARFALDLLARLEGMPLRKDRQYIFGQVFDTIAPANR
jgi:hypothetical protein